MTSSGRCGAPNGCIQAPFLGRRGTRPRRTNLRRKCSEDGDLLVPVGVELNAALLHQHWPEMFGGSKLLRVRSAFTLFLPSACVDDAGVDPGGGVFVEAGGQIGGALRLVEVVKDSHFGFVVGPSRFRGRRRWRAGNRPGVP